MTAPVNATGPAEATSAARRCPRVLMVTGAYHPEISSSALQCRRMARELGSRVDVRVLTTSVNPAIAQDDEVDGVPVSRVLVDVRSAASRAAAAVRMLSLLLKLVPRSDVIHLHGCSSKNVLVTAVARMFGRPVVLSLHTAGFDEAEVVRQSGRLPWWAFTRADRYLSVSPGLVEAYLDAGLPADRIQLVANGIDTARFAPAGRAEQVRLREALGLPVDVPVILFVGFFSHDKQPRVLFDAWRALRTTSGVDAALVFVGATESQYFEVDDQLVVRMRADADAIAAGHRVVFTGARHDVHDFFRAADVYVLPSRREGLPVALLEAMSCGLPCVASRLSGSTDAIVEDGVNGLLVPPGDVAAFAGALGRVLGDTRYAAALGAAARETIVQRYTSADTADQWLRAYDRLGAGRLS